MKQNIVNETKKTVKNTEASFTNIKCFKKKSIHSDYDEYKIKFVYKGEPVSYFIFAHKSKHLTLEEAKKRFNNEMNNGELEKYAKQFIRDLRPKKMLVTLSCFFGACALAGAGVGIYFLTNNNQPSPQPPMPEKTYIITWKNDDGTILEVDENVPLGTIPSYDHETPQKEATAQYTYTFSGWDGDITKGITGDTTFIAQYSKSTNSYSVFFDSDNGGSLIIKTIEYGNLIPIEDIPEDPSKEDKIWKYKFDGWHKVIDGEMEEEEFEFDTETITDDTMLTAKWEKDEKQKYKAKAVDDSYLAFSQLASNTFDDVEVIAGEAFTCNIAIEDDGMDDYLLPTTLDILIGDSFVPIEGGYKITTSDQKKGTVTIEENIIDGDVTILGSPVRRDYYNVKLTRFGVNSDRKDFFTTKIEDNLYVDFTQMEQYELPSAENIYIKIDNREWITPADAASSDYCVYNPDEHELTIYENVVRLNLSIRVRSPQYKLLDDLSWKKIADYSESGWAPYLFYLGEEKTIRIDGMDHQARIIGFNHDQISGEAEGTKAGITFELSNVYTSTRGVGYLSWENRYEDTNYNFPGSFLNTFLNGAFYDELPDDLKTSGALKKVLKPVAQTSNYKVKSYSTNVFVLSYYELTGKVVDSTKKEGDQYLYYKTHSDPKSRLRTNAKGEGSYGYWVRSPCTSSDYKYFAWCVDGEGNLVKSRNRAGAYNNPIAPAFCI